MLARIVKIKHIADYRLELTFSDGFVAELDFRGKIVGRGGVFEPLEDVEYFKRVEVDGEVGTLQWPNGVDFCPDALYSEASGEPLPIFKSA